MGLYNDDNERALSRALSAAKAVALPGTRFGIQIAHSGRKGSAQKPWDGGHALGSEEEPWPTVAPSPIPFDEGWPTPGELDAKRIARIRIAFAEACRRAVRIGFDVIELHMAHGYLLHEFLSPLANNRIDEWGQTLRFPLAIAEAVAAEVPGDVAWGARITASDWAEGGITPRNAAELAATLADLGASYVDVSSGGITPKIRVAVSPGYQVPFAAEVKRAVPQLTVRAVGMIVTPAQAQAVVEAGEADQVAIARAVLDNPRWGWHAAEALGTELPRPPQYRRAAPSLWPGAALVRERG
jgi:2,4-dienoyl-CoA reductase-like NADH-dependent reductase (Old Yellow Enzyme family)